MTPFQHSQYNPPELSDEAAAEIMLFFREIMIILENHYGSQLRKHFDSMKPEEPDLFEGIDDPIWPF